MRKLLLVCPVIIGFSCVTSLEAGSSGADREPIQIQVAGLLDKNGGRKSEAGWGLAWEHMRLLEKCLEVNQWTLLEERRWGVRCMM